ncbi:MAG: right-handed parallel beta-helix repeat-containing protein [Flavobacteriaceae bacterium]|nr:right-handed parallel beta-helix repeat-containing protein [Flavobacteriaceae bacterium]
MKILFTISILFLTVSMHSQLETIISDGDFSKLQIALNSTNISTITIKENDITITSNIEVPYNKILRFFNGTKFIIGNNSVNIYSDINANSFQIFETPENHNLKIHNQEVYPEWFGFCDYQDINISSNNDAIIIQKAINSLNYGGNIMLKGEKYLINSPIEVNVAAIKIKGKGNYFSKLDSNNLIANNINTTSIFNINVSGVRILDLNFVGFKVFSKGKNAVGKALSFVKENSKDIDAYVTNCSFKSFRESIYAEGSNLKITDNLFTWCYIGVNIKMSTYIEFDRDGDNNPDSKEKDDIGTITNNNPITENNPAVRGFIIDRNRFHSLGSYDKDPSLLGSTCIKIRIDPGFPKPSSPFYNFYGGNSFRARGHKNKISNNYADDCKTFFDGSIDRTSIENNSIVTCGGTAIKASGVFGAIINNYIDGSWTWNAYKKIYCKRGCSPNDLEVLPNGTGIEIDYAHFTTIHNNQIHNVRFHGIHLKHSKNSSIQLNTIMNFNRLSGDSRNGTTPDYRMYDGIHIDNTSKNYNIQNIVSNNTISITIAGLGAKYGIYIGDGDAYNFVNNNFILPTRLVQNLKIE